MITDRPDTKTTDKLVITELFNAFVAFLFAASAPVAIILSVALGGGLDEVQHMLAQREPTYQAVADVVLDINDMDLQQVTDAVLKHC